MSDKSDAGAPGPLQIDHLPLPGGGTLGMIHCPGRNHVQPGGPPWARNLSNDLRAIRAWRAKMLVSLIEDHEFERLGVANLAPEARAAGLAWCHLPIQDMHPPAAQFEKAWQVQADEIEALLAADGRLILHCAGGLGRTGTIAARLLIDRGLSASNAMEAVRAARPGAIETPSQEAYLRDYAGQASI